MWVQQRIGPFPPGKVIVFPGLKRKEERNTYPYKYIRIGIQSPQSPWITEARNINYNLIDSVTKKSLIDSGIKIEDDASEIKNMNGFYIGTDGNSGPLFFINPNEIIEFENLEEIEYFKVIPMKAVDAYTIIEIQYLNDKTS